MAYRIPQKGLFAYIPLKLSCFCNDATPCRFLLVVLISCPFVLNNPNKNLTFDIYCKELHCLCLLGILMQNGNQVILHLKYFY